MALTPLKQRPATAVRRIPIPNGSVLLVPNDAPEPAPEPEPPFTPPTAQWDINTRGRTDNDFYEHVNGTVEASTGNPTLDQTGLYDAMVYNGVDQYTRCAYPANFTSGMTNSDFTLAARIAINFPSVDFEWWVGWGNSTILGARVGLNTGVDNDTKATHVSDAGTTWFGNPDPDAPQDGTESVIVFRRMAGVLSIWKEGVKIHEDASPTLGIATTDVFEIGAQGTALPERRFFYDGKVYWVAAWDSALPDEEVPLLSNTENPFSDPPPIPGEQITWNPGWYMLLNIPDSEKGAWTARQGYYDQIANDTAIKGVCLQVPWDNIEGDLGVYDVNWLLDDLNYLAGLTVPKQLWIRMADWEQAYLPNHIFGDINRQCRVNGGTLVGWRRWDVGVVQDYVNALAQIAALLDDSPNFEGITLVRESALTGTVDSGQNYNATTYQEGMNKIASDCKALFTKSNVVMNINTLSNPISPFDPTIEALINYNTSILVGQGGPDTSPQCTNNDGVNGTVLSHGFDAGDVWGNGEGIRAYQFFGEGELSGIVPVAMSIEATNLGSQQLSEFTGYSWDTFKSWLWDHAKVTHCFVQRKDFLYGLSARDWLWSVNEGAGADDYLLPKIQADPEFPPANIQYPYPS